MVVGAPNVDHAIKAALKLVQVVGDVGGEVGGLAVVAFYHAVFVVTKAGGQKPQCAVALFNVAVVLQAGDGAADLVGVGSQAALGKPLLIVHAEFAEVFANIAQYGIQAFVEDNAVVVAEQGFGAIDQVVNMLFFIAACGFIGANAVENVRCAAH